MDDIESDSSSSNSRRKRSFACDIGKRRMRRSCVIIPPPPPPPPTESPFKVMVADNLGFDGKYFFPNQTPNYNMSMFESSCLYWDEENQTWTGHGCRVSKSYPKSISTPVKISHLVASLPTSFKLVTTTGNKQCEHNLSTACEQICNNLFADLEQLVRFHVCSRR